MAGTFVDASTQEALLANTVAFREDHCLPRAAPPPDAGQPSEGAAGPTWPALVATPPPTAPPEGASTAPGAAGPYRQTDEGFFYHHSGGDEPVRLAQAFTAYRLDGAPGEQLLVTFPDRRGTPRECIVRRRDLLGEDQTVPRALAALGFTMDAGRAAHRHLKTYLFHLEPAEARTMVSAPGWQGRNFVFPEGVVLGPQADTFHWVGPAAGSAGSAPAGRPDAFRQEIAPLCAGNPLLGFAVSEALAAALLGPLQAPAFGVHVFGESTLGKSTTAGLASSAWGGPERRMGWNLTAAGFERIARARRDTLFCLDEIREADPRLLTNFVYQIGNGHLRGLGTGEGGDPLRLLCLSTGEHSLRQTLRDAGVAHLPGLAVRMLDVPVGCGGPHGAFAELHGRASPAAFAEELERLCREHYGWAGRQFVGHLGAVGEAELRARWAAFVAEFLADLGLPAGDRVGRHFALCGFAGEEAAAAGITGWPAGLARAAARHVYAAWREAQKEDWVRAAEELIAVLQRFVRRHAGRFVPLGPSEGTVGAAPPEQVVGYRSEIDGAVYHLLLAPVFTGQALPATDRTSGLALLVQAGVLVPDRKSDQPYTSLRVGSKVHRVYRLRNLLSWSAS